MRIVPTDVVSLDPPITKRIQRRSLPDNWRDIRTGAPPVARDSETTDLIEFVRLIGRGLEAEYAYLLIAPFSDADSSADDRQPENWRRITWRSDEMQHGKEALVDELQPELPSIPQGYGGDGAAVPTGEDGSVILPVRAPDGAVSGYLGIKYPLGLERPNPHNIRLLQDILGAYLHRLRLQNRMPTRAASEHRAGAENSDPALILVQGRIAFANPAGYRLLDVSPEGSLVGRPIEDFVSAEECESLRSHLGAVALGWTDDAHPCTLVGATGHEHSVEIQCRSSLYQGAPSLEIEVKQSTNRKPNRDLLMETISEAVWHVKLRRPVPITSPALTQARLIRREGYLVECNSVMADLFALDSVESLLGRHVRCLIAHSGRALISAFVESNYRLQGYEYYIPDTGDGVRLFSVNAMGTVEDGYLTHVWGSCSEITDRLEMAKQSVALQEEQQARIGRDLHDSVGPLLTGMRLLSGDLPVDGDLDPKHLEARMQKISNYAEEATRQLTDIYRGLVPRVLEQNTLAEALQELAETIDTIGGVRIRFSCDHRADVDEGETKMQLYRIVQEAVNNAVKHAQPNSIQIVLRRKNGKISVQVRDDGKGFDVSKSGNGKSLGLDNMKRRAHSIGAALEIDSGVNSGTRVSVTLQDR